MRHRCKIDNWKVLPAAPTKFRSTHAVNSPAPIPAAKNGSNGVTSRFLEIRPRFHQNTTSNTAGSGAITVLDNKAATKRPSAAA